ncbi:MAG: hypothetical protein ACK5X3_10570 [Pseudomonadota bacterium]|nr:hypothetical protein [Paracoccaceae bacterium]
MTPPELLSDKVLFPALQLGLMVLVVAAALIERRATPLDRQTHLRVTRAETSMKLYYGAYLALSGLLVALCLQVELARNHRVFWVLLDVALVSYLCIWNAWFRHLLQNLLAKARTVEVR